jgi:hypothetical protein
VAGAAFKAYRQLVQERQRKDNLTVWVYGSANPVDISSRAVDFWLLDSWAGGATGIVPWQTLDKSGKALVAKDDLALFIMDQSVGDRPAIRSTLRLKAFLQTQQLIEKLNLLKSQKDLTVGAINELLAVILSTKIEIRKRNDDDAGTAVPASDNAAGVDDIRLTVEEMLGRF